MRESLVRKSDVSSSTPIHAVTEASLPQVLDGLGSAALNWCKVNDFAGKPATSLLVPGADGAAVLFGVEDGGLSHPLALGGLVAGLPEGDYHLAEGFPDPEQAALGFALSTYSFTRYLKNEGKTRRLAVDETVDLDRLGTILDGVQLARDLINTPANDLGPGNCPRPLSPCSSSMAAPGVSSSGKTFWKKTSQWCTQSARPAAGRRAWQTSPGVTKPRPRSLWWARASSSIPAVST